jgi:hypothetical protein
MNSKLLDNELRQLSKSGITVTLMKTLDFVIPGDYNNSTQLTEMVRFVGKTTGAVRQTAIAKRAEELYAADEGAQRAIKLYKLTDKADKAVAAAALANKVGSRFKILSFLTKYTPKADTVQTIDLCLKMTVEAIAYLSLHGMSVEGIGDWAKMITQPDSYSNESALRIAAIIGFDGLIPLGPDFLGKVTDTINGDGIAWKDNALFNQVSGFIPGGSLGEKTGFISNIISTASAPVEAFVSKTGLTREKMVESVKTFTDVSDDALDYVAAFLDASTNYMTQTGVQTVARKFAQEATEQVDVEMGV